MYIVQHIELSLCQLHLAVFHFTSHYTVYALYYVYVDKGFCVFKWIQINKVYLHHDIVDSEQYVGYD
jgi:hypothetical protein